MGTSQAVLVEQDVGEELKLGHLEREMLSPGLSTGLVGAESTGSSRCQT
jgi:hypothetical protein